MDKATDPVFQPGTFWEMEDGLSAVLGEIEEAVEREVYRAIRELLTMDNPDFLLWWFGVPDGKTEPTLHFVVEGRGLEDIERDFPLSELVDDALDGYGCGDGITRVSRTEFDSLATVAESLRSQADRVAAFLATAQVVEEEVAGDE